MAGSLGDLVIALHADIAKFESDMGRAARISERQWGKVSAAAATAAKALAAAAAVAGAAALKMGYDVVEAAAKLDDLAEKTGASVEELSKLSQQARISGESMETVELGLIRLSKALHDTDDESKGAGKALAALGLKADDLRNKDTAEALRIVAGELSKFQDGAGKTALALDLFGKSGAQLLPILKDMAAEGALNVSVTAKQAAEAEELQKALRRLANQAEVAKQQLMLMAAPVMSDLLTVFLETSKATGSFAMSLNAIASIKVGRFGETTAEQLRQINDELEKNAKLQRIFTGWLAKPMLGITESNLLAAREAAKAFQRREALALGGTDTAGEMQRFRLPGAALPKINYTPDRAAGKAAKAVVDEALRDRMEQMALSNRMHKADLDAQKYFQGEIEKIHEEAARDRQSQLEFNARMQKADLDAQLYYVNEIKKYNDDLVKSNKEDSAAVNEFWRAAYEGMQRAASDLFFDAMQGKFDNFATRFKAMVDRMVADWLAAQALMAGTKYLGSKLGGANDFGNLIGGLANAIGGTQAPAPVFDAIPSFVGSFADGTDYVPRTGLALVHQGEWIGRDRDGPEGKSTTINVGPLMFQGPVDRRSADQVAAAIGDRVAVAMRRNR